MYWLKITEICFLIALVTRNPEQGVSTADTEGDERLCSTHLLFFIYSVWDSSSGSSKEESSMTFVGSRCHFLACGSFTPAFAMFLHCHLPVCVSVCLFVWVLRARATLRLYNHISTTTNCTCKDASK